ncbi:hypothetical protein TWF718_008343 [Orbilia javanica]|uniref:Uncharacterized protein n=1 Tax=Orbilia javanica TaxID=47235 RepID=A0AAN8MXZ7_9PEZI
MRRHYMYLGDELGADLLEFKKQFGLRHSTTGSLGRRSKSLTSQTSLKFKGDSAKISGRVRRRRQPNGASSNKSTHRLKSPRYGYRTGKSSLHSQEYVGKTPAPTTGTLQKPMSSKTSPGSEKTIKNEPRAKVEQEKMEGASITSLWGGSNGEKDRPGYWLNQAIDEIPPVTDKGQAIGDELEVLGNTALLRRETFASSSSVGSLSEACSAESVDTLGTSATDIEIHNGLEDGYVWQNEEMSQKILNILKPYNRNIVQLEMKLSKGVGSGVSIENYNYLNYQRGIKVPIKEPPVEKTPIEEIPKNEIPVEKAPSRSQGAEMDLEVANSENWRKIREQNPLYRRATFANDVWTIDTTRMLPRSISKIPTRIAGRPVILNYTPSIIGSFPDNRPDPIADKPIDPRKDIDDETLRLLFRTYPGVKVACVYLNKTLVLLHDGKLDRRAEFGKGPRKFGGLDVNHASFDRRYTSPTAESPRQGGDRSKTRGSLVEMGLGSFGLEYTLGDHPEQTSDLRVGVRLRYKREPYREVLTMPVHSLFPAAIRAQEAMNAGSDQVSGLESPWANPAGFLDANKGNYKFQYDEAEFGELDSHFEFNTDSYEPGDMRVLRHDIVLIKELDDKGPVPMPFPVFRYPNTNCVKLEWANMDEVFAGQNAVLMGYNIRSNTQETEQKLKGVLASSPKQGGVIPYDGSRSQTGQIVATPHDYEGKTVKIDEDGFMELKKEKNSFYRKSDSGIFTNDSSMDVAPTLQDSESSQNTSPTDPMLTRELAVTVEGRSYECGLKLADITEDEKRDILSRFEDGVRDLRYFQRSILWRADSHGAMDGLPSIGGASGCPLAIKTGEGSETVYKVFGFQNSEILVRTDDPGLEKARWAEDALLGNFRTYQSICLPDALVDDWEIVWDRPEVKSEDVDMADQSPTNDRSDARGDYRRGTRHDHWMSTTDKISKMRTKAPRLLGLRQRRYNRDLLRTSIKPRRCDRIQKSGYRINNTRMALRTCWNLLSSNPVPRNLSQDTQDSARKMLQDALTKLDAIRRP